MADDFDDGSGDGDSFDDNDTATYIQIMKDMFFWNKKVLDVVNNSPINYPELQAFINKPSKESFEALHESKFPEELRVAFAGLLEVSCCVLHAFMFFISTLLSETQKRLPTTGEGFTIQ